MVDGDFCGEVSTGWVGGLLECWVLVEVLVRISVDFEVRVGF